MVPHKFCCAPRAPAVRNLGGGVPPPTVWRRRLCRYVTASNSVIPGQTTARPHGEREIKGQLAYDIRPQSWLVKQKKFSLYGCSVNVK